MRPARSSARAPRSAAHDLRTGFVAALALFGLAVTSAGANAQPAAGEQRFWLQLGAFQPSVQSELQITDPARNVAGTVVKLESQLGLARKKALGQLLIGARLGERWRTELEYFSLRRSASRTLSADIVVDDTTYPAQSLIDSALDSKVVRFGVGYSLLKTPVAEAGLMLGLHVTDFRVLLAGQGSTDGGALAPRSEQREQTVPLPTLGVYGSVAFAPGWQVAGRASVFSLNARGYDGRLIDLQAHVVYRFHPSLGVGLGYRFDRFRLGAARPDFTGRFEYRLRGPQLFVEAGF